MPNAKTSVPKVRRLSHIVPIKTAFHLPLIVCLISLTVSCAWTGVKSEPITVYVNAANAPGPGGGTLGDPFVRIQDGIDAAEVGATVQVSAGVYNENLQMKSGINVSGMGPEQTAIVGDAASASSVVTFSGVSNATLSGFTITAIEAKDARAVMFEGQATDTTAVLERCVLLGTQYGVFVWSPSTPTLQNNTLMGHGLNEQGVYIGNQASALRLRNNIITGYQDGIRIVAGEAQPHPMMAYNDVWNNATNYANFPDQTGLGGNISTDPLFVSNDDLNLQIGSPAIDAGDPDGPLDPDGTPADMGALPFSGSSEN